MKHFTAKKLASLIVFGACLMLGALNSQPREVAQRVGEGPDLVDITEADWEYLNRKCENGLGRHLKKRLIADAREWLTVQSDPYVFTRPYPFHSHIEGRGSQALFEARMQSRHVLDLAFAGKLTGDERFLRHAIEILDSATRQRTAAYYADTHTVLATGDALLGYALGYAWLKDDMSQPVRERVRERMRELASFLYEKSTGRSRWGRDNTNNYVHNWNTVTHGRIGLAGLVLDKPEWVELAEHRARGFFRYTLDETGANFEGLMYAGYGFHSIMPFVYALEQRTGGGEALLDEFPRVRRFPDFLQWLIEPWGGSFVKLNQSTDRMSNSGWLLHVLARYEDREGLWAWLRLNGDSEVYGGNENYGVKPAPKLPSLPFAILWHDPDLQAEAPDPDQDLWFKTFERGISVAREGWRENDALLTFISARAYKGVHNHPDANSFTFYANGDCFAADPGPGKRLSKHHSVVLIDGKGMDSTGGGTPAPGKTLRAQLQEDRVLLRGDARQAYAETNALESAHRDLGMKMGESLHLVVSDRYVKLASVDNASFDYAWNYVTSPENEIILGEDGRSATIIGGRKGSKCDVRLLHPREASFEKRASEGKTPPRLIARHTGRRGDFIVVLTPRRPDESSADVTFIPAQDSTEGAPSGSVEFRGAEGKTLRWRIDSGAIKP